MFFFQIQASTNNLDWKLVNLTWGEFICQTEEDFQPVFSSDNVDYLPGFRDNVADLLGLAGIK